MKKTLKTCVPYVIFILVALAVGALSGIAVSGGMAAYDQLIKPPLAPPDILFPIAWTVLYILMGVGAAKIWRSESEKRRAALAVFFIQLAVNGLWSVFFFGMEARLFAFFWLVLLWALIWVMTVPFFRINRCAALLQIPYLVWVAFAGYLNLAVWLLNR